jgi:serpin B
LSNHLKELGAPLAFDEVKADFSGINSNAKGKLNISKVIHQAVVEVNEEGTEAAAATAAIMTTRMLVMPTEFICDRPFLFIINEKKTNAILFIGKFLKP